MKNRTTTNINEKYIESKFIIKNEKKVTEKQLKSIQFTDYEELHGFTFQEFVNKINGEIKILENRDSNIRTEFFIEHKWDSVNCGLKVYSEKLETDKECMSRLIFDERLRKQEESRRQRIKTKELEELDRLKKKYDHKK